jgi:hypothetical protein
MPRASPLGKEHSLALLLHRFRLTLRNFGSPEPLLVRLPHPHGSRPVQPFHVPKSRHRTPLPPHRSSCQPRCTGLSPIAAGIARLLSGLPETLLRCLPASVPFSRPKLHHSARRVLTNLPGPPRLPQHPYTPAYLASGGYTTAGASDVALAGQRLLSPWMHDPGRPPLIQWPRSLNNSLHGSLNQDP